MPSIIITEADIKVIDLVQDVVMVDVKNFAVMKTLVG